MNSGPKYQTLPVFFYCGEFTFQSESPASKLSYNQENEINKTTSDFWHSLVKLQEKT